MDLTFDGLDNLRSVSLPNGAGTIDYTYDFRGQHAVTSHNVTIVWLSATHNLEFQDNTAILWPPFGDARVAAVSNGRRVFLHLDLSGTPTLFTGKDGTLKRHLAFGPYEILCFDSSQPQAGQPDTGLVCLG